MNQPSIIARVAGTPVFAIPLTLGGIWLIFMWTQGEASVWLALAGCFVAAKTISSVKQLRRYKAWRKEWDSIGRVDKARPQSMRSQRFATYLALSLFFGIIAFAPQMTGDTPQMQDSLMLIWLICGVFLCAKLVLGLRRFIMRHRKKAEPTTDGIAPVSLMLERTVDSPSRETAVMNLPDYAARILNR